MNINGITVKEAENLSGVPMPEIIQMIKSCQIFGMCFPTAEGYLWYVSPAVIPELKKLKAREGNECAIKQPEK